MKEEPTRKDCYIFNQPRGKLYNSSFRTVHYLGNICFIYICTDRTKKFKETKLEGAGATQNTTHTHKIPHTHND